MKNIFVFEVCAVILTGCGMGNRSGNVTVPEDVSVSGVAASSIAGALSASSSNGTTAAHSWRNFSVASLVENILAPQVQAATSGLCPKIKSATGCAPSGLGIDLTYANCSFGSTGAAWSGDLLVSLGSGSLTCGAFPNLASLKSNTVFRQFVSGTTAASGTRTSALGTVVTMSHAKAATGQAELGNFDLKTISSFNGGSYLVNNGWGTSVSFSSAGRRSGASVFQNLTAISAVGKTLYNHSVAGTVTLSDVGSTRTISGTVTVYHNLLQIIGTATFTDVTHTDACCAPTSGTISTVFSSGTTVDPTAAGVPLVGKTETLSFSSTCGQARYTDAGGATSTVALGCF